MKVLSTNADPIPCFHLYLEYGIEDIQEDDAIEPASLDAEDDIFDQLLLAQPLIETTEGKVKTKIISRKLRI